MVKAILCNEKFTVEQIVCIVMEDAVLEITIKLLCTNKEKAKKMYYFE